MSVEELKEPLREIINDEMKLHALIRATEELSARRTITLTDGAIRCAEGWYKEKHDFNLGLISSLAKVIKGSQGEKEKQHEAVLEGYFRELEVFCMELAEHSQRLMGLGELLSQLKIKAKDEEIKELLSDAAEDFIAGSKELEGFNYYTDPENYIVYRSKFQRAEELMDLMEKAVEEENKSSFSRKNIWTDELTRELFSLNLDFMVLERLRIQPIFVRHEARKLSRELGERWGVWSTILLKQAERSRPKSSESQRNGGRW